MQLTDPISLAVGIVLCLAGWALYWIGLHLTGAILGAAFGLGSAWLGMALAGVEPGEAAWILPLGGAVGFCLGIFFMRGFHRFFFFFLGAAIGLALGHAAHGWAGGVAPDALAQAPALWQGVFLVAGTLLGGLALARGSRLVVTGIAALAGAILVAAGFGDALALLAVPPLALASFFLQTGLLKRLAPGAGRRPEADEED